MVVVVVNTQVFVNDCMRRRNSIKEGSVIDKRRLVDADGYSEDYDGCGSSYVVVETRQW
jgi:hypothetical protein